MSDGGADAQRLLELLGGKWIAQALSTAAALGVAEALSDGPLAAGELAGALGCEADGVARLMSVLAGLGAVARGTDDRFTLTSLGRELRQDRLGALAAHVGEPSQWDPWARLRDALRSRETAFEKTHGSGLFDYLAVHHDASARYDAAVDAFTRVEARSLAEAVPELAGGGTVVDIGGGRGTLLATLLARWEGLRGVLFDLPHVAERVTERLVGRFGGRLSAVGGDFHQAVPGGADFYVVRHVLHNWGDDEAAALLARCREAMAPGGRVLVVEGVLLPGDVLDTVRLLDLEMLVLTREGRERSKPELRRLFSRAGLKLERVAPLAGFSRLLVGGAG
ncbi:MAG: methyltransferase domain-containing protein [Myxococcales bacterium]|nr:methyltransferase domain-containing protein [Myxococcales bacterium]MCB9732444.1 methyltransferase domain-containing protein [Deltaproteobacteria bacterium]